ncbi:hypothetical protein [Amycolatopsis sp. NPDC001319]|uniref:hypothetical protein n=1 Tax=unclassified Amycolatopsis TaxID=2618356 RepID=UPI00367AD103
MSDDDVFDDGWYDDELLGPPKEEPDCMECQDYGCRWCRPTPWQRWWWLHVGHRLAAARMRLRRRANHPLDEPPF